MHQNHRKKATKTAFKWAAILFIAGSFFIYLTDILLEQQINNFALQHVYQTYKGIGFCAFVALVLFVITRRLLIKIHEEKRELRHERRFSKQIQNSIPGIFFVLDEEGLLIRWNKNTNQITGLSDNELNNLLAIERIEESDREKGQEALKKVFTDGKAETELFLKTTNEEKRLFKITANRFKNDGNTFIVGTGIDITEENRLKEKLAGVLASEQKKRRKVEIDIRNLKETLDQTPLPRCILEGPQHVFSYANKAYKRLVGSDDLQGKKLTDVIPEVEEQGYVAILNKVYNTGESYIANNQYVKINRRDDNQKDYIFNLVYEPLHDSSGDVYGIYCEGIEVSDQIEAHKKIKRQNYQLKTAQEMARLGYWESNLETGDLIWSDIIYELFGLDKETFTNSLENFLSLIHPDDRDILELNLEQLKQGETFESQYRLIKPNGDLGWFREVGEVYKGQESDPEILHGIVQDITEQKNQENKIRKSYINGENKERKRISSELHDGIAQYLSAVLLHLDNAEDFLEKERGLIQLHNARKLVKRAVIETRTISQNLMPQTIEKHGLITAVKSLIKQYQLSSEIKFIFNQNIEVPVSLDKEIETNVYRIIQELLSNAVRHSNCDQIWITLDKEQSQLTCIIKDNGIGALIDDIKNTDGLGLQSIRDRVELLYGSIEFNNKLQEGLVVTIKIPLD